MKLFLPVLLMMTVNTGLAQNENVKIRLSKASYRLSVYNNEKLLHQDMPEALVKWDSTKKIYTITIDPRAMCTGCKESSARGILYLNFSMENSSAKFITNPALEKQPAAGYSHYYPVLEKNGELFFIDVRQSNGSNVYYNFDFAMFNSIRLELKLYKTMITDNRLSFVEVPQGRVSMQVVYKKYPQFKGPKVAQ